MYSFYYKSSHKMQRHVSNVAAYFPVKSEILMEISLRFVNFH